MHQFSKKVLFPNALGMLNEKILCLPSILLFERTVHKMNHPNLSSNYLYALKLRMENGMHNQWFFGDNLYFSLVNSHNKAKAFLKPH